MERILAGLAIGLFGGAALGIFVIGPIMQNQTTMKDDEGEDPIVAQYKNEAALARQSASTLEKKIAETEKALARAQRERDDANTGLSRERQEYQRLATRQGELEEEIAALREKAGTTGENESELELTPEEREAQRLANVEKAKRLKQVVDDAIKAGNKTQAVDAVVALLAIGADGYEQYFAAYDAIVQVGNPWGGTNTLGLSMFDFNKLMNPETADYLIANIDDDSIPASARASSPHVYHWSNRSASQDEVVATLCGILESSTDSGVLGSTLHVLGYLEHPQSVPHLATFAAKATNNDGLRIVAIDLMARIESPDVVGYLEQLGSDPVPEIAAAAKKGLVIQNPPATGIYITSVTEESQAMLAGVHVGDIMLSYNGVPVLDISSLTKAKDSTSASSVTIEVYRDGQIIAKTIAAGQIGINGVGVTKK